MKKFSQDRGGGHAGLIAYYGFFALFPLLLAFVAILGFVLHGHPGLQAQVVASAKRQFPSLSDYLRVGSITGSGVAVALGLATALWAGLGVTRAAQDGLNAVWGVPVVDRPNAWQSRLRGLGLLAALGTATLASTAISALNGIGGQLAALFSVAGTVAPLALNIGLYAVAFQVLTSIHLTWRQVLPGALVGAVAWTALQLLGGYYTRHYVAHASHLYGTFAVVIGLLAWIHLGAQVTLYAAEINVVLVRKLWPRGLSGSETTDADRRAMATEAFEWARGRGEAETHRRPDGLDDAAGADDLSEGS